MVHVEDRMSSEGEVLHAFVRFGSLQRTEEHEADAQETQDRENQDDQERIGEAVRNERS